MRHRARNAAPLDAVDLEGARLFLKALEDDLKYMGRRARTIRETIEEIQGRTKDVREVPTT